MRVFLTRIKCLFNIPTILVNNNAKYIHSVRSPFLNFKPNNINRNVHDSISSLHLKKRPVRKKKLAEEKAPGLFQVLAFSTAEEYNLEKLVAELRTQGLYEPKELEKTLDVVHAIAKYRVEDEPRELFFFREGGVVLWNCSELESSNVLSFLKKFESDPYSEALVTREMEVMNYRHSDETSSSKLEKNGDIVVEDGAPMVKYTFSNAMALSVKLGVWEASLDKYIEKIEFVTEDLKHGKKIRMSRQDVLRRHGELFALRHLINLSSDLLDTPDFYWEHEHLEKLYVEVCQYLNISKRTKVINEKINHCVELIELLSTHLSDKHHIRLEWMIIILIMVEVAFETIHYIDRIIH